MKKLYFHLSYWFKAIIFLILGLFFFILSTNLYELHKVYSKYSGIIRVLILGERLISTNNINRSYCTYVNFKRFPELKDRPIINLL